MISIAKGTLRGAVVVTALAITAAAGCGEEKTNGDAVAGGPGVGGASDPETAGSPSSAGKGGNQSTSAGKGGGGSSEGGTATLAGGRSAAGESQGGAAGELLAAGAPSAGAPGGTDGGGGEGGAGPQPGVGGAAAGAGGDGAAGSSGGIDTSQLALAKFCNIILINDAPTVLTLIVGEGANAVTFTAATNTCSPPDNMPCSSIPLGALVPMALLDGATPLDVTHAIPQVEAGQEWLIYPQAIDGNSVLQLSLLPHAGDCRADTFSDLFTAN